LLDRDKLRALGFKIVEPDDESQATVIFTSKEAVEAVRRMLRGGTAATGQERTKTDPKRPSVRYYVYSAVDGTPVGMLRVIRDETEMQIDRVGKNGGGTRTTPRSRTSTPSMRIRSGRRQTR
jgi:hypothetical protein